MGCAGECRQHIIGVYNLSEESIEQF